MKSWPLRINGEDIDATPENTSLFKFAGANACFDHVFIILKEEDESMSGSYIFKESPKPDQQKLFKRMHPFLIKHDFPQHINLQDVAECDQRAFFDTSLSDLDQAENMPDWWNDGTQSD